MPMDATWRKSVLVRLPGPDDPARACKNCRAPRAPSVATLGGGGPHLGVDRAHTCGGPARGG